MARDKGDMIYWYFTPNRIPYTIAFILGILAGGIGYHMFQSKIENTWPSIPYLGQVKSLT